MLSIILLITSSQMRDALLKGTNLLPLADKGQSPEGAQKGESPRRRDAQAAAKCVPLIHLALVDFA